MRDTTDMTIDLNMTPHKNCKVSYTLDNFQPVRSTFIGDEPLFFMDYEPAIEDDDEYDEFTMDFLEKAIGELKVLEEDRHSFASRSEKEDIQELFVQNATSIENSFSSENESQSIEDILEMMKNSRLAAALISHAEGFGIKFEDSTHVRTAFYDRDEGKIFLHPRLPLGDKINLLAMELRRHWQHRNGTLIDPLFFHPDQAILVNRVQAADIASNMVRIAWEMQLAGHDTSWNKMASSSMSDLAHSLAREAAIDFRSLNNGHAQKAVFETWFMSDRCCKFDKMIIQNMLSDHNGLVFGENMTASMNLTSQLIEKMGEMPYGKNYLTDMAHIVTSDPVFTDVRDRANANFLWFIKFERSFRESEQELQNTFSEHKGAVENTAHLRNEKVRSEQNETETIVQFPVKFERTDAGKASTGTDAQIIELGLPF